MTTLYPGRNVVGAAHVLIVAGVLVTALLTREVARARRASDGRPRPARLRLLFLANLLIVLVIGVAAALGRKRLTFPLVEAPWWNQPTETARRTDFYQATCPPCRRLEPRLQRVAREYEGRLPVYRVDVDRDLPVAQRFAVMSLPTVLILRDGQEIERLDGLITEQDVRAAFDRAVGR